MKTDRFKTGTKIRGVYDGIRQLAIARGPNAKLPTAREFCAEFKINTHALNETLRDLEAQNIVIRRQGSGIYVSPRIHRKTIAVILNSMLIGEHASPFWGSLLHEFAVYAETRGLANNQDFDFFITSPSSESHGALPDAVRRSVREGSINGVVALSLNINGAQWLIDQGVPCTAYAGWSKWIVTTASEPFIQAGLQALVDQGCRRIEYWGLPNDADFNPEWYKQTCRTVETAFKTIGIDPPQTLVGPSNDLLAGFESPSAHPSPYRAHAAIKAMYRDPARPRPDGIFVGDDTMASGLLLGLLELGVRVGVDIKIATQANRTSHILLGTQENMTLLEYDPAEIAEALIQLLEQAMEDPDLPETEIRVPWRIRLPCESVGRAGIGAIKPD